MNIGAPCQSCSFTPRGGFECVAEQWQARYAKTTHPGLCWNGRCPDNAFDVQEVTEAKKARRDFERRRRQQHEQLRIEAA